MLTQRQSQLLDFIREYTAKHHFAPSFEEMRKALGLGSKSGIHRMVLALEERGYIIRHRNRARSIDVLAVGEDSAERRLLAEICHADAKGDFVGLTNRIREARELFRAGL